jgi:L1 cell adhesion molecule like protein
MSKDEIEKLIKDAEKYKDEDEKIRKTVEAKNALENYIYSVGNTLNEEKLKDKFTSEEREKIESKRKEL